MRMSALRLSGAVRVLAMLVDLSASGYRPSPAFLLRTIDAIDFLFLRH